MRRLFLSAGHSNTKGRDMGASGNGFIEGEEAVKMRNIIKPLIKGTVIVDKDDSVLADTLKEFKGKTLENDILVEIHFNAASPKATGVETLVPANPTVFERTLAQELSTTIGNTLKIPLRGSKGVKTELESHHSSLGWMRPLGTNILIEVCFISNPNDMKSYSNNKELLCANIASVLNKYLKE